MKTKKSIFNVISAFLFLFCLFVFILNLKQNNTLNKNLAQSRNVNASSSIEYNELPNVNNFNFVNSNTISKFTNKKNPTFISKNGFTCNDSVMEINSIIGQEWMHVDQALSKKNNLDVFYPYYTSDFIFEFLEEKVQTSKLKDMDVFEFGGGMSSLWWASHVNSLTIVDDKISFLCAIEKELMTRQIVSQVNLIHFTESCFKCLIETLQNSSNLYDIIVVDGEPTIFRCGFLIQSIPFVKNPNGFIIADNWNQPNVWINDDFWCGKHIEDMYEVTKYEHSERNGKKAHENGWKTVHFYPHRQTV